MNQDFEPSRGNLLTISALAVRVRHPCKALVRQTQSLPSRFHTPPAATPEKGWCQLSFRRSQQILSNGARGRVLRICRSLGNLYGTAETGVVISEMRALMSFSRLTGRGQTACKICYVCSFLFCRPHSRHRTATSQPAADDEAVIAARLAGAQTEIGTSIRLIMWYSTMILAAHLPICALSSEAEDAPHSKTRV